MARESIGSSPPPMAMEREVNEVPAKLREGPGRGSDPECLAMEDEVNPLPAHIKEGSGGRVGKVGGFHEKGERGKTFKERREEIRRKGG